MYEGYAISSRPKVEADITHSCTLAHVRIYSIDEWKVLSCNHLNSSVTSNET